MGNRFPAFPFYPNDWLGSARRMMMTLAEQGAYFNLLCHYWNSNCLGLPSDDISLRMLCGDVDDAVRMPVLRSCFIERAGFMHNEKMEAVYKEKVTFAESASERGKKGAEQRWLGHDLANGKPIANDGSSSSSSSSSSLEEEDKGGTPLPPVAAEILNLWNDGRPKPEHIRMTPKRKAKIQARLKEFTPDQIKSVIKKVLGSEWHQGANDRGWKAPGPEWVLHTTERVEEWLAKGGKAKAGSEAAKHQGRTKGCGRCNGIGMVYVKAKHAGSGEEYEASTPCGTCGGKGKLPA